MPQPPGAAKLWASFSTTLLPMTTPLDTVRTYLAHLHASHTDGWIAGFEDDGVVH